MFDFLGNSNIWIYLAGYLVGAIPFGLLLAKRFAGVNIKDSGSKSIGATNVLRVVKEQDPKLAKKLGGATLALDAIKGMAVLWIGVALGFDDAVLWGVAFFAVLGHCYSPYLGFEGGKGVATGVGIVMVMLPVEAVIGLAVWFGMAKTVRISSVSSLVGLIAAIVASYFIHPGLGELGSQIPLLLIGFVIFYKHLPNLIRLFQGKEGKAI